MSGMIIESITLGEIETTYAEDPRSLPLFVETPAGPAGATHTAGLPYLAAFVEQTVRLSFNQRWYVRLRLSDNSDSAAVESDAEISSRLT
jgi:hypothetical protein